MKRPMILAHILFIAFFFGHSASAKLNEGSVTENNPNSSGYVGAALSAASASVSSFNSQDDIASKAAGDGLSAGVYVNSSIAIAQFQRQYDAANKMLGELNAALAGCIAAADAEIAAAEAELKAAQAAAASCSDSSDSESGSSSGCAEAAAAAAAAAQAKIDKANANKAACKAGINPLQKAGAQAATDVSNAAQAAGFTLQASKSQGGGATVVAKPGTVIDPNKQVYVPKVNPIDTSSLDFWANATSNGYPGGSQSIDDLIGKLPKTTPSATDPAVVREAGLLNWIVTTGRVGFTVWGLSHGPSDTLLNNSYMQLRAMEKQQLEIMPITPY